MSNCIDTLDTDQLIALYSLVCAADMWGDLGIELEKRLELHGVDIEEAACRPVFSSEGTPVRNLILDPIAVAEVELGGDISREDWYRELRAVDERERYLAVRNG